MKMCVRADSGLCKNSFSYISALLTGIVNDLLYIIELQLLLQDMNIID